MDNTEDIFGIDLKKQLNILWNKKWIIIIVTLVAIILSTVINFFVLQPTYGSSTTVIVGSSNDSDRGISNEDIALNKNLVDTYSVVIKSESVLDQVISNLELNYTADKLKNKIEVNPVSGTEIIEIKVEDENPERAAEIANNTASVFMQQIIEMVNIDNIQVIDKARVRTNPISPDKIFNIAVSALLGVMLGLAIVFLREYLDNTFKSSKDSEKYLDLPTLGAIPIIDKDIDKKLTRPISFELPSSIVTESYRGLRTNMIFSSIDKKLKTILITSASKNEGKSTVVTNLAVTIAQDNNRVLLVDCDFRKPTIHKQLYVSNLNGLSSVLTKQSIIEETIQQTEIPNLDVLTSGPKPPNPSEMLGSDTMSEFLSEVSKDYDIVLIDTPPVGMVTDAAVLSKIVDGVLFTVEAKETPVDEVRHAKQLLEKVDANIIGVVLNRVSHGSGEYYPYEDYEGYNKEDTDTKNQKLKK